MKRFAILALLSLCLCKGKAGDTENVLLAPAAFQQKLSETPDAVLLDVRTMAEVREECIKGQLNFDFQQESFKTLIAGVDNTKPYFLYCAGGVRSAKAADLMADMGFKKLYTLDGGIKAWKQAGLPTRKPK